MLFLTLALICASAQACLPHPKPIYSLEEQDLKELFEEFIVKHAKAYDSHEDKANRFQIFKQNVENINKLNSDYNETAIFDINKFADLTTEQFIQTYTGFKPLYTPKEYYTANETMDVPDSFDWRTRGVVTRVKDQGQCGSCWAFSTTGAVEGAYAIQHGQLQEFSEKQLVDCDTYANGCQGGLMQSAVGYIREAGGQMAEGDYPYYPRQDACRFDVNRVAVRVSQQLNYNLQGEADTKNYLVSYGPVSIGIYITHYHQFYKSGILNGSGGDIKTEVASINHAVLLVGYGGGGQKYYIIKNSWGSNWGEQGYFRLAISGNPDQMYNGYAVGVRAY